MHDNCEVTRFVIEDREAAEWLSRGYAISGMDIHHIHGRPLPLECNYWCNLIRISKAVHAWGHDRNPYRLEICCWRAKAEKHKTVLDWLDLQNKPLPCIENLDWHEPSLDRVVSPFASYVGRIEFLMEQCQSPVYFVHGQRVLQLVDEFRSRMK